MGTATDIVCKVCHVGGAHYHTLQTVRIGLGTVSRSTLGLSERREASHVEQLNG
jgi:hypothetical protein